MSKLLVDIESGKVLRADDRVVVSYQYLDSHPFIAECLTPQGTYWFVGKEAHRRVAARSQGHGEAGIDAIEYEQVSAVGAERELVKVGPE